VPKIGNKNQTFPIKMDKMEFRHLNPQSAEIEVNEAENVNCGNCRQPAFSHPKGLRQTIEE
jgi:hypothetical protein